MLGAAVGHPPSARPRQPAFGADAYPRSIPWPAGESASDQALVVSSLRLAPAVSVRCVEKLDVGIQRGVKHRNRTRLVAIGLRGEPHAAEARGTHADDPNWLCVTWRQKTSQNSSSMPADGMIGIIVSNRSNTCRVRTL